MKLYHYHFKPKTHRAVLGKCAENLAVWYLKTHGWQIVDRNYATRGGEIDIIAVKYGNDLKNIPTFAFVEVKARSSAAALPPQYAVCASKRKKMIDVMKHFISCSKQIRAVYRCDIASIIMVRGMLPRMTYFPNAFFPKEEFGW